MFIFIPFAFGGNPASESGPRAVYDYFTKKNIDGIKHSIIFEQTLYESAYQYMLRINKEISLILKNMKKNIIIGGNHLSLMPIYQLCYARQANILTLDAHRDYYPQDKLNHATFLKYISGCCKSHFLVGYRDTDQHNQIHPNITALKNFKHNIINTKIDYLDIDIDVLDPYIFPWCGSAIDNGMSLIELMKMVDFFSTSGCNLLSISEYIPNYDMHEKGLEIIYQIVSNFLIK